MCTVTRFWSLACLVVLFVSSTVLSAHAVTRDEAVAIVRQILVTGTPYEGHCVGYALHTPLLAGEQVWPSLQPEPGDTFTVATDTWLVFINDNFMSRFVHPCRFAFVDDEGTLTWLPVSSWPVVAGVEQWGTTTARTLSALANDEIVFGAEHFMYDPGPPLPRPNASHAGKHQATGVTNTGIASGSNDGAIVIGGTGDPADDQGVDEMEAELLGPPANVPPGKMNSKKDASKQDFCDMIDSIAAKPPLDKLYFAFIGHGLSGGTDGEWALEFRNGDESIDGAELREKLKKTKAKKICIVIEACYSGCLIPALKGAADTVEIGTATDKTSESNLWEIIHFDDLDGDNVQDSNEATTGITYINHYWEAFIGCLDSSRTWKQTHEWAVAQMDSADSAAQKPQYGKHHKRGASGSPNRVIVEDNYFRGNQTSLPLAVEVSIYTSQPVGSGFLPLLMHAEPSAPFPLVTTSPFMGFNPGLGPGSVFEVVNTNQSINGVSPDAWAYLFQSSGPPDLDPLEDPTNPIMLSLTPGDISLMPPGTMNTFTVGHADHPQGHGTVPIQLNAPGGAPLIYDFCPGDFEVERIPIGPPIFVLVSSDNLNEADEQFFLTHSTGTGSPGILSILEAPLGTQIEFGPGPYDAQVTVPRTSQPGLVILGLSNASDLNTANASSAATPLPANQIAFAARPWACDCDCHGDPVCNGVIANIQDVVATVNVAFRGSPAILDPNASCPFQTTDMNCDGVTSVTDVVKVVNVAFRGAAPATEYCNPCP